MVLGRKILHLVARMFCENYFLHTYKILIHYSSVVNPDPVGSGSEMYCSGSRKKFKKEINIQNLTYFLL